MVVYKLLDEAGVELAIQVGGSSNGYLFFTFTANGIQVHSSVDRDQEVEAVSALVRHISNHSKA